MREENLIASFSFSMPTDSKPRPNLGAETAAAYLSQLDDPMVGPLLRWDIERRLLEVKSTCLAVRYLLPRNAQDRDDAIEGLVATCFRAKKNLFVVPGTPDVGLTDEGGKSIFWETRAFIIEVVLRILNAHKDKEPVEIVAAALAGKFRHIPRIVKLRMIDKIRRHKVMRSRVGRKPWSLDFKNKDKDGARTLSLGNIISFDVNVGRSSLPRTSEPDFDIPELCMAFRDGEAKWKPRLGDRAWEVLLVLADMPDVGQETKRSKKGLITRAIAERRKVGVRQARADKAHLRKCLRRLARTAVS